MSADKKFIVWDWNGTLLDNTQAVLDCVNIILKHMGYAAVSMETLQAKQTWPVEKFYMVLGVLEHDIMAALTAERTLFHDHYEPMADIAPLREGADNLLAQLAAMNVSSIIVSNHIAGQIERVLKRHDIYRHFEAVLAFADRKTQFNEKKGQKLRRYIAEHGFNPANAIIIGDTEEEIEEAHRLGMTSIAITGGINSEERLRAKRPHHLVHSLAEAHGVLRQCGFVP